MPFLYIRDRFAQVSYSVGYLLLALGAAFMPSQFHALREVQVDPLEFIWWIMTAFLGVGGLLCAVSQICHRWVGEYIGLPLIITSLFSFGLLQANLSHWSILSIPSISLLWAFAAFGISRWRETMKLYRIASKAKA